MAKHRIEQTGANEWTLTINSDRITVELTREQAQRTHKALHEKAVQETFDEYVNYPSDQLFDVAEIIRKALEDHDAE